MLKSIKKLFNKLGFKYRDYEPPVKTHWVVKPLGSGYIYYQDKPVTRLCVSYYKYTGSSFNNKRFKEVEAVANTGQILFRGYISSV